MLECVDCDSYEIWGVGDTRHKKKLVGQKNSWQRTSLFFLNNKLTTTKYSINQLFNQMKWSTKIRLLLEPEAVHPGDKLRIHEKVISAGKDNLKEISNQWVQATPGMERGANSSKLSNWNLSSRETNSRKLEMSINSQDMGVRQWKITDGQAQGKKWFGWKMGADQIQKNKGLRSTVSEWTDKLLQVEVGKDQKCTYVWIDKLLKWISESTSWRWNSWNLFQDKNQESEKG